jgi:hypothetical protein
MGVFAAPPINNHEEIAMTLSKMMFVVPMLAMAFFATGCGASCESLCEDGKECKDAEKSVDCDKQCEEADDFAEKSDCSDQYDDVVSCMGDQDDICKVDEKACESELKAWGTCVSKYCTKHLDDKNCTVDGS